MAVSKTKTKTPNLTINKIELKTANRTNVDISNWRQAHSSAERGRVTSLYDLYDELLLDNVLFDAIEKRVTAITNAELTFTRNGEKVDEIDTLIDTMDFEDMLREIMLAKFFGITLLEFEFLENKAFKVYPIPRKHIRAAVKEVAINQNDDRGIPYNDDFFLEVGKPRDLGILLRMAPYVIYKRNNFGDWSQYVEINGMPIRTAYYDGYDENFRQEILRAFDAAGSILANVMPKGCDFKIEPGALSGDGEIYNKLRGACNEELLIGTLGQTMTTLNGSSRSQGEVHLQIQEDKHKADRRFVQRILNSRLLPMLEKRGYAVSGGYFYFPDAGETISLKDRILIDEKVASMVPIPAQHLYDTYGIARPEDGEDAVMYNPMGGGATSEEPDYDPADDDPEGEPQNHMGRWRRFFALAPIFGAAKPMILTKYANIPDAEGDSFDVRLIKRVARGDAREFDAELFDLTARNLIKAFRSGWVGRGSQGVIMNYGETYGLANSGVITANETNLYHFAAAKTLSEIQQLNQIYRGSKNFNEYYAKATALCGKYNKSYARTEYETARLTAESAATYHRLKAQQDLFPFWQYRTIGDSKVREEHAALDGLILSVNDPRWRKMYPPNGWKCRCRVVPMMKEECWGTDFEAAQGKVDKYFKSVTWKKLEVQGFAINRADINQVFTANQMYIRKFPNNAAAYLNKIDYRNYGLDPYTKCIAKADNSITPYTGTADDWFAARAKDGRITFKDFNDRDIVLSEKTFKTHTTGSHESRVKYLQSISETILSPDEVWLNAEQGKGVYDNYFMLKHFSDGIIAVCCQVDGSGIYSLKTWFPLHPKAKTIRSTRRGLLVYKKTSL